MALKETMDDPYDKYEVNDTEFFFYFEIPFNFIMTGLIVQFYSWYQFGVFIKHELDPQMALDYRVRYKLGLLVSIIVCFTGLIVQFSAVAIQRDSDPLLPDYISKEFKVDMDWIMITLYSVISFSFLPLFISIMLKIRKHYDTLYKRMRIKFTLLFTIFMIFILGRLFLYFDVKSLRLLYSSVTIKQLNQKSIQLKNGFQDFLNVHSFTILHNRNCDGFIPKLHTLLSKLDGQAFQVRQQQLSNDSNLNSLQR